MTAPRVRFAPSPTGQIHIGNIRVAIFNWLHARAAGGQFLLRVEDTDRERSTPEAIAALREAMDWLGLEPDEPPVYQSAQAERHRAEADRLLNLDLAYHNSDALPAVVFRIDESLFDPSFVTEPREEARLDTTKAAAVRATLRSVVLIDRSEKTGEEFFRPVPWDTIAADLAVHLAGGACLEGAAVREKVATACGENVTAEASCDLAALLGGPVAALTFRRRFVFFDDLILGRREKPLDSLRDLVIVRGDGSPVFHLANVVDDITMGITHILRGNDHLENTFRHLFLCRAVGAPAPQYGHLPMIVNAQKKPYSKRDGDAYVGDFRQKGVLPEALFNFLALCGWSPGDDREVFTREELCAAFHLDRVVATPAEFNAEKLAWMNGQHIMALPLPAVVDALQAEARAAGASPERWDEAWWRRCAEVMRERLRSFREFMPAAGYLFGETVQIDWEAKKIRKVFKKESATEVLREAAAVLAALPAWTEEALGTTLDNFAAAHGLGMGAVAQPLRIAITGGTASPGIQETLFLVGRDRTLKRLAAAAEAAPQAP